MIEDGLDTFAEEVKLKTDPKRKRLDIFIYSLSKTNKQKNNPCSGSGLTVLVKLKIVDHMATLEYKIDQSKINTNEVMLWYLYIIYTS